MISITKLYSTLRIYYMNIQNVSSSRLYTQYGSTVQLASVACERRCVRREKASGALRQ